MRFKVNFVGMFLIVLALGLSVGAQAGEVAKIDKAFVDGCADDLRRLLATAAQRAETDFVPAFLETLVSLNHGRPSVLLIEAFRSERANAAAADEMLNTVTAFLQGEYENFEMKILSAEPSGTEDFKYLVLLRARGPKLINQDNAANPPESAASPTLGNTPYGKRAKYEDISEARKVQIERALKQLRFGAPVMILAQDGLNPSLRWNSVQELRAMLWTLGAEFRDLDVTSLYRREGARADTMHVLLDSRARAKKSRR